MAQSEATAEAATLLQVARQRLEEATRDVEQLEKQLPALSAQHRDEHAALLAQRDSENADLKKSHGQRSVDLESEREQKATKLHEDYEQSLEELNTLYAEKARNLKRFDDQKAKNIEVRYQQNKSSYNARQKQEVEDLNARLVAGCRALEYPPTAATRQPTPATRPPSISGDSADEALTNPGTHAQHPPLDSTELSTNLGVQSSQAVFSDNMQQFAMSTTNNKEHDIIPLGQPPDSQTTKELSLIEELDRNEQDQTSYTPDIQDKCAALQKRYRNLFQEPDGKMFALCCSECGANTPYAAKGDDPTRFDMAGVWKHFCRTHSTSGRTRAEIVQNCKGSYLETDDIGQLYGEEYLGQHGSLETEPRNRLKMRHMPSKQQHGPTQHSALESLSDAPGEDKSHNARHRQLKGDYEDQQPPPKLQRTFHVSSAHSSSRKPDVRTEIMGEDRDAQTAPPSPKFSAGAKEHSLTQIKDHQAQASDTLAVTDVHEMFRTLQRKYRNLVELGHDGNIHALCCLHCGSNAGRNSKPSEGPTFTPTTLRSHLMRHHPGDWKLETEVIRQCKGPEISIEEIKKLYRGEPSSADERVAWRRCPVRRAETSKDLDEVVSKQQPASASTQQLESDLGHSVEIVDKESERSAKRQRTGEEGFRPLLPRVGTNASGGNGQPTNVPTAARGSLLGNLITSIWDNRRGPEPRPAIMRPFTTNGGWSTPPASNE